MSSASPAVCSGGEDGDAGSRAQDPAGHYARHARGLYRELMASIDRSRLRALHRRSAARHLMLAARQLALLVAVPALMWAVPSPWVWVPGILLQGFVFFGFSVLLHDVIHKAVFATSRPRASAALAMLYGVLGFLSPSQFTRWHLDHHRELGSKTDDPKRAHLSPKRNLRRVKLLYFTPWLALIYFAAAARAARDYPIELRRRIARERWILIAAHGTVFALLWWVSPWLALGAHAAPLAFGYPIAFSLNRLGQHYVIDPDRPEAWSTLVRAHPVWHVLFLYSSHHLEHHLFPGVPCYRLPALQKLLQPRLDAWQLHAYGYGELLRLWLVHNHPPHSRPAAP